MLKKVLMIVCSLMLVASVSFAESDGQNGSYSGFIGGYDIDADAAAAGGMISGKSIPNGGAFGLAGGIGSASADAYGVIFNGTVEGEVTALGGGLAGSSSYRLYNPVPDADKSIGVRSASHAEAYTGASFKIKVDPDGNGYFFCFPTAGGLAGAEMSGFAAQGTLNASYVGDSPLSGWETDGFSGGIAAQGSVGGFEGYGYAVSGPDYREKPKRGHHNGCQLVDSKAGAGAGVEITMIGNSYSQSYRYMNDNNGVHTEGMGTFVGADTTITSYGYNYDWDKADACSNSSLSGGYFVAGGAATKTVQNGDFGGAKASAVGVYAGAGSLGSNFSGSAYGYSNTSVTTYTGMNGSINTASSGMQVTATGADSVQPQELN